MFDSIRDDINSRLLTANKATTAQAQAGTNDTNYTTPLKVKTQLQYLTKTGNGSNNQTTAQDFTIYSASNVPNGVKRVVITGNLYHRGGGSYPSYLHFNGTGVTYEGTNNTINSYRYPSVTSTQLEIKWGTNRAFGCYKVDIDLNTKTFTLIVQFQPNVTNEPVSQFDCGAGYFTTLTDITASLSGSGGTDDTSTISYTVTYMY